jgi:LysR family transcriptional regulator, regulator of abg operon
MNAPSSRQLLQRLLRRANLLPDFLAVARAGGIRQAAEQAAVTQSALTRRIQELEQALDVKLFERSVQGMALTPFGRALLHHAQMVEMNCNYAASELTDLLSGTAGELRLAAGPAWAYELLPDAIAALTGRLPGVKVSILTRMNEATLPMLDDGRLDVVLGGFPAERKRSTEIRYEPLIEVEHLVFAAKAHVLHRKRKVLPADLVKHPWIWFDEAVMGRHLVDALMERAGTESPTPAVATTSVQSGFRLLKRGTHVMLLPSTLRAAAAREGLAPVNLRPGVGRYAAGLMYRPSLERLRAFREFRQALFEVLEGEADLVRARS